MSNFKYFEEIERYLKGEMSLEEKASFEQRIKQEPAVEGELRAYQAIAALIEKFGAENKDYVEHLLAEPLPANLSDEFIWEHLLGRLPAEKVSLLTERVVSDLAFARRVRTETMLVSALQEIGGSRTVIEQVEQELKASGFFKKVYHELDTPIQQKPVKVFQLTRRRLAIAASVLVLVCASSIFYFLNRQTDLKQEFITEQSEKLETILNGSKGFNESHFDADFKKMVALLMKDSSSGFDSLQIAYPVPPIDSAETRPFWAIYLYALHFFEAGNYAEAALQGEQFLDDRPPGGMQLDAYWMLALCYAELGDKEAALKNIEKLRNDSPINRLEKNIRQLEMQLE